MCTLFSNWYCTIKVSVFICACSQENVMCLLVSEPWEFFLSSLQWQTQKCWGHLSPSISPSWHQVWWKSQCGPHQHCECMRYKQNTQICDVVEAHCYVVDIGRTDHEQIRSRINNNWCRTFQLQFCMQLTKAYVAETSCIICYWFCYVSAHDQFVWHKYIMVADINWKRWSCKWVTLLLNSRLAWLCVCNKWSKNTPSK